MNGRVLVQNATMVLPNRIVEGDLRVSNGLIKTVAPFGGLQPEIGELVIDGTGLHLLPGAIDPHVHLETLAIRKKKIWKVAVGLQPQEELLLF